MNSSQRIGLPILILIAIGLSAWLVHAWPDGRALSVSLLCGAAFGIVLQRARFCFLCNFRDLVEARDPRGAISILVALGVGALLYTLVMMAWAPVPQPGRLPPGAHIGPVSPVLALAALVFGLGMAISGSCLSAHLYRLGEGSPGSPFALLGAGIGFFAGFLSWNGLYTLSIHAARPTWLPHSLGYTGSLLLSLALLAALAVLVLRLAGPVAPGAPQDWRLSSVLRAVFVERWSPVLGGVAVAVISAFAFLRVAPLGVTAELGSIVRTAGAASGYLPDTLHGLDLLRGCATVVKQSLLSPNGLFVLGLVAASFAAALASGRFHPALPTRSQILRGLSGGILMGWGAMIGLGCTVGVLLSGIHAGALSGWVFLVFCVLGAWLGLAAMRRFT